MPTLLDIDLLSRFEARLRALGALIVENWAPGLTDAQIDELLRPVGIDLPEEARVWWRWHDGVRRDAPSPTEISPARPHRALRLVLDEYSALREEMLELNGIDALLRPVGDKPLIYFACGGARDDPVPIYAQNDHTTRPRLVATSIGELVLVWISLIDRGVWATDEDGNWAWDHERVPQDVLDRGIY